MEGHKDEKPFQRERKILGKTIKRLRVERRLTQEDLANRSHMNVSYLAKIENGYVNTTVRYLIKISRGLRIRTRDLVEF